MRQVVFILASCLALRLLGGQKWKLPIHVPILEHHLPWAWGNDSPAVVSASGHDFNFISKLPSCCFAWDTRRTKPSITGSLAFSSSNTLK